IDDPAATVKLLDELKQLRAELRQYQGADAPHPPAPRSSGDWRDKSVAFERFDAGWRMRWDASGLAFRSEAGDDFPHSGREARKLSGALRSPLFTIEKPYLAIRVAGRESKARVILNGLQLIQEPIYGGLAQSVNHGDEYRWLVFNLKM